MTKKTAQEIYRELQTREREHRKSIVELKAELAQVEKEECAALLVQSLAYFHSRADRLVWRKRSQAASYTARATRGMRPHWALRQEPFDNAVFYECELELPKRFTHISEQRATWRPNLRHIMYGQIWVNHEKACILVGNEKTRIIKKTIVLDDIDVVTQAKSALFAITSSYFQSRL